MQQVEALFLCIISVAYITTLPAAGLYSVEWLEDWCRKYWKGLGRKGP
jgi:hypothetical protein